MIRNYLRSTLRILLRERLSTIINSFGLAVGLATCFLIYSWVRFERSYDTYLPGSDRIYRIATKWDEASEQGFATTYPMIRTRVLSQFPEIEASTRLFNQGFLGDKTRISLEDKIFTNNQLFFGDSTFLKVFPFRMLKGDASSTLRKPNAVILTAETAAKFFGGQDPIGKTILIEAKEFEVTGVLENIPANTHFHFDLLASMQSHPWIKNAEQNVWSGISFHTYIKLKEGTSPEALQKKLADVMDDFPNDPQHFGKNIDLQVQPVQDIHLKSNMKFELAPSGNNTYVQLFITIAALVMIVAMINYINLSTARHTQRFKEVAVRKVLGASRKQLIVQFMLESLGITFLAFAFAVGIVELAQPYLGYLSGQPHLPSGMDDAWIVFGALGMVVLIGLLTGLAPALALSGLQPVRLFKGANGSFRNISVRKVLVVVQFTVSIALTICTTITYRQIRFLQDAKLGYNLDRMLVLNIGYREVQGKYAILKTQLLNNTAILGAAATSQLPTDIQTEENVDVSKSQTLGVHSVSVDPDFFKVMGIPVQQGEPLISSIQVSDSINHFVLNESTVRSLGWKEEDAINKVMTIRHGNMKPGTVVGVVGDFHFLSLHHAIGPLVLEFDPSAYQYLLIKVKGENMTETIKFINNKWDEVANGIPFDYMFLDQEYDKLYKSEQRSGTLFIVFSCVALLISLLGLFALSTFAVEKRTKEIGLRKVLGADMAGILALVSSDFILLLVISFGLAVPIGLYYMNAWMANFAFKAYIGPGLFLLAGSINILLGLLTLSYHSLKISRTDPVKTLRYE